MIRRWSPLWRILERPVLRQNFFSKKILLFYELAFFCLLLSPKKRIPMGGTGVRDLRVLNVKASLNQLQKYPYRNYYFFFWKSRIV